MLTCKRYALIFPKGIPHLLKFRINFISKLSGARFTRACQGKCPGRYTSAHPAALAIKSGNNKIIYQDIWTVLADATNDEGPQFSAGRGISIRAAEFGFFSAEFEPRNLPRVLSFAAEFDVFHSNNYFFKENDLKVALLQVC